MVDNCSICHGAGWVTRRVPVTDPDFGVAIPCRCQQDGGEPERRTAALERYSKLGYLRLSTFAAANPDGPTNNQANRRDFAAALNAAVDYADNPEGWLTFVGASGSGKTYLAAAIANRQIEAGNPALFLTVVDLLDYLRSGFDDDADEGFIDLLEQVRNAPLLVLDDLPAQPASQWGRERLFQLLSSRHSARLPTVITLRGTLNHVDEYLRTRLEMPDFSRVCSVGSNSALQDHQIGMIPPKMRQRMTFDAFDTDGHGGLSASEKESLITTKNYMQNWINIWHIWAKKYTIMDVMSNNWIFLYGSPGAGKTHLAVASAAARNDSGDTVFFSTAVDLLDYLRSTFSPDSIVAHADLLHHIKTVDLLVLDDIGAERSTPFAEEKLLQIIDYRYAERLPTIITTSRLDVVEQSRQGILSRLSDPLVVTKLLLIAPDYRRG